MTDQQRNMKKYTNAIERKLHMPRDVKARVMNDFITSIQGRRENGQTDEAIFAELGAPKKVADDLNEQMKEYTYVKNPWRWACLAVIVGSVFSVISGGALGLLVRIFNTSAASSIGIIGGADGPTAIFVTASPDYRWYKLGISILVLILGILGYYRVSHCRPK